MKRIISILLGVVCTVTLLQAQDIIITRNAQRIEAKIIELSSDSVKYLDPSNPEGFVSVLRADEISSVLFQNGQVKLYDKVQDMPVNKKYLVIKESVLKNYLFRSGDTYFFNDKEMRGREYEQFLRKNCATAYNEYRRGKKSMIAGWALFGSGLAGVCSFTTLFVAHNEIVESGLVFALELTAVVTASACALASFPCIGVGYARMHRSAELFNCSCAHKQQAYWSVNASQNGFGIAYNF